MSIRQTTYLLVLLFLAPFITLGQSVANSELITSITDLANKTFTIGEKEVGKTGNDLSLFLVFHEDGNATFRVKRGNTVTSDSPLSFRFVGDSLYLYRSPISIVADGKTQLIDREPDNTNSHLR